MQTKRKEEPIRVVDGEEYWYCKLDLSIMMDSTITTHDAMVYAALCSFTSPTKANCYPSLQAIAARAKCSARQVTRCLNVLEEKGYIKVFRRKDERKSSIYYLTRKRGKTQAPNPQEPAFEPGENTMDCESVIDHESIDCESIGQAVYPARTHSLVTIDSQSDELESRIRIKKESHRRAREAHDGDDDSTPPSGRTGRIEKPPREEGDILPDPSEDPPRDLSPLERKILSRIKPVMGSKYDIAKDRDYLRRLMTDYPELDIGEVMEDWATWAEGKYGTLGKKQNPHSQWRNFCRNARNEGRHILIDYRDSPRTGGKPGKQEVDLEALKEKYGGFVQ